MSLTTGSLTVMASGRPVVRLVTLRVASRTAVSDSAACAPAACELAAVSAVDLPISVCACAPLSLASVCVSISAASTGDAGATRVAAMTKAMPPNRAFFKLISLFLIDMLLCDK